MVRHSVNRATGPAPTGIVVGLPHTSNKIPAAVAPPIRPASRLMLAKPGPVIGHRQPDVFPSGASPGASRTSQNTQVARPQGAVPSAVVAQVPVGGIHGAAIQASGWRPLTRPGCPAPEGRAKEAHTHPFQGGAPALTGTQQTPLSQGEFGNCARRAYWR